MRMASPASKPPLSEKEQRLADEAFQKKNGFFALQDKQRREGRKVSVSQDKYFFDKLIKAFTGGNKGKE